MAAMAGGGGGGASRSLATTSLKPAAVPLMDSGKAIARSGELLIDWATVTTGGGGISKNGSSGSVAACGAYVRNAGDCLAQAAASCRFKTGTELVCDELREAAVCLNVAATKLKLASEESSAEGGDGSDELEDILGEGLLRRVDFCVSVFP
jgi:hypothetical protein